MQLDEDSEDYKAPLLPHAALCAKERKPVTLQTLEDSHQEYLAFRLWKRAQGYVD